MPKKRTVRELRVVFDTNPLHTQSPSDLINAETRKLIEANSTHPDLQITWYVPEIVVLERHYQMLNQAEQLLPGLQRISVILGIGISVTEGQLSPKIASVIDTDLSKLNISKLLLDHARVDWKRVIHDAAFRNPPFQSGKNEKGFRDAMILEAFVQLVEAAPTSAARCRLALVTNDERLTLAAKARMSDSANAEVLAGLEELRNLINTLISTVDEAFVKELREKASRLFFVPKDEDTLYYREKIADRIREKHSDKLREVPDGVDTRELEGITIAPARFLRKEHQRVYWSTQIRFNANAYKYAPLPPITDVQTGLGTLGDWPKVLRNEQQQPTLWANVFGSPEREKIIVKKVRSVFDVAWSTTLDKHKKLVRPQIDSIDFVETMWE